MNLILAIFDRDLFGQQHASPLRGTVGTSTGLEAHQTQHGGRVDDPPFVT